MPIDYQRLKNWPIPTVEHAYCAKDTILYALSVGFGSDPLDERQLRFVHEDDLVASPTMAVVLAYPGMWLSNPATGVDWTQALHGEQSIRIHKTLPAGGTVIGRTVVEDIIDKGAGKGALIYTRRDLLEKVSGEPLASLLSTTFCRSDGGFGGPRGSRPTCPLPDKAPDLICDLPTMPQSALLYRLNGDHNSLHAVPRVAAAAGFARPILHGLCTLGVAGHALLRSVCDYDPGRLRAMSVRFTAPVFPGETIRTETWREKEGCVGFRCRVVERDIVAINNGVAELGG
jgi:acyl dehydratase